MKLNYIAIERQATEELQQEEIKKAVELMKAYLIQQRPWWRKIFPWRIKISITNIYKKENLHGLD